jgi:hypothetical protein
LEMVELIWMRFGWSRKEYSMKEPRGVIPVLTRKEFVRFARR